MSAGSTHPGGNPRPVRRDVPLLGRGDGVAEATEVVVDPAVSTMSGSRVRADERPLGVLCRSGVDLVYGWMAERPKLPSLASSTEASDLRPASRSPASVIRDDLGLTPAEVGSLLRWMGSDHLRMRHRPPTRVELCSPSDTAATQQINWSRGLKRPVSRTSLMCGRDRHLGLGRNTTDLRYRHDSHRVESATSSSAQTSEAGRMIRAATRLMDESTTG